MAANGAGSRAPVSAQAPKGRHSYPCRGWRGTKPRQPRRKWGRRRGGCICRTRSRPSLELLSFSSRQLGSHELFCPRVCILDPEMPRAREKKGGAGRRVGVIATLTSSCAPEYKPKKRGTGRVGRDTWRGTLWSPDTAPKHSLGRASSQPSLSAPALRSRGCGQTLAKQGSRTPLCPARFCQPGLPCPIQGHRPLAFSPSGRRREAASPPQGSPSGRGWQPGAPSTEDQSGGAPQKAGAGPDPWEAKAGPGMPDPGADEQAGPTGGRSEGVVAGTYLSLRAAGSRVAACGHVGQRPPEAPPRSRALAAAPRARARRRPHFGAGPRHRGLTPSGPYHRAGQGCPGRAAAVLRPWGPPLPSHGRGPTARSSAHVGGRGSPNPPQRDDPPVPLDAMAASGRAPLFAASASRGPRARPRLNPRGARASGRADASRPARRACPRPPAAGSQHHPAPPRTLVTILQALTRPNSQS